jgi:hypothetical protein
MRFNKFSLFLLLAFAFFGLSEARALPVYGVTTGNQLVRFDTATPNNVTTIGAITGLQTGENVLGIDFRPANGQLYGLGSTSRLYTINLITGAATQVGTTGAFTLTGADFGFDFNPTVDRIRVVSNTGQNLRLNPNDGSLTATDGPLNPGTPSAAAAAYTNNFAGATTTTLYVIDSGTDTLNIQNPPNNGTLVSVGALGVNTTNVAGFDISPTDGTAFAALTVGMASQLYRINLTNGAATLAGNIGGTGLRAIAIPFGAAAVGNTALDFDGDRRADYANFRLTNNNFTIFRTSNNGFSTFAFGLAGDILQPGDYDGDGRADVAVWRNGIFYVLRSSNNSVQFQQFGLNGDEPVARDYDGDGRTDFAVARRTTANIVWYILNSSNNSVRIEIFGMSSDSLAPGDYDGDGRFDLAVKRGSGTEQAVFYIQRSSGGLTVTQFGLGGDANAPGDYDGDGKTDLAVIREGTNWTWYILRSSNNSVLIVPFGGKGQFAVPADYDGDGKTDIATFQSINALYYVLRSGSGNVMTTFQFGQNGDYPVANYNVF